MDHSDRKDSNGAFGFNSNLTLEEKMKPLVGLLFVGHHIRDVSSKLSHRKLGVDFFLTPNSYTAHTDAIACENKFEQYATGRLTLEMVSVDRPYLVPGWFFTSRAGWLLSWMPSQEVIALPMAEVRKLVFDRYDRYCSTSTINKRYLTWNTLEDINYLLANCPNGRYLDLTYELGLEREPGKRQLVKPPMRNRLVTADQLVELMQRMPKTSEPIAVSEQELKRIVGRLAPLNLKKHDPNTQPYLSRLSWLQQQQSTTPAYA